MVLFDDGSGELGADAALALFADSQHVHSVLHGPGMYRGGRGRFEAALGRSGSLLCFPLLLKPYPAVAGMLKQGHRLVASGQAAEELLSDVLTSASVTEISSPEEEAHLGSHQAHAAFHISVGTIRPPLPLSGAEGIHGEDEAGHDCQAVVERLRPGHA